MPRRVLQGQVVSDKMDSTAVVLVERRMKHPLYGKTVKKSKKYHAHNPDGLCAAGDLVDIRECSPISKTKRFEVINVVTKASAATRMDAEDSMAAKTAAKEAAQAEKEAAAAVDAQGTDTPAENKEQQ